MFVPRRDLTTGSMPRADSIHGLKSESKATGFEAGKKHTPSPNEYVAQGNRLHLLEPNLTFIPRAVTGTTVTLLVGPQKTEFNVHKQLLYHTSSTLLAGLARSLRESPTQTVIWPEEEVQVVTAFLGWLYFGRIGDSFESMTLTMPVIEKLHIFAERWRIVPLMDHTINAWLCRAKEVDRACGDPSWVYSNTRATSELRRLIVDSCAHTKGMNSWNGAEHATEERYPRAFLLDVLNQTSNPRTDMSLDHRAWLSTVSPCQYHQHPFGKPCSLEGKDSI